MFEEFSGCVCVFEQCSVCLGVLRVCVLEQCSVSVYGCLSHAQCVCV